MADIITEKVLQFDLEQPYNSLAELAGMVETLKARLAETAKEVGKDSAEYQKQLAETKRAQSEYNRLINVTASSVDREKGSYYELNAQLVAARHAWKEMSAEERAADAQMENGTLATIKRLDTELKALDAQVGQHQRNVGNYTGGILDAANAMRTVAPGAAQAATGIMGFKRAMDAASANPIVAVLSALVIVLQKVGGAFKSSETAMNSLTVAFAPFKAAGQAVTVVLQNIAEWLGKMGERLLALADRWGLLSKRAKENIEITKEENALRIRQREVIEENARLELTASKARTEAVDKANLSARQRLALLEEARKKEEQILENNKSIAQRELALAERRAELTHNDTAALDALSQARANVYRVEREHYDGMRRIASQISAARKEILGEAHDQVAVILDDDLAAIEEADAAMQAEADKAYMAEAKARTKAAEERRKADEAAKAAEIKDLVDTATERLKIEEEEKEKEQEILKQRAANQKSFAAAVSSILGSVASAWAQSVQAQVDAGKISREEGERQFAAIKTFQYAQTLINTAAAVMTAFAQPPTVPWLLKAAQASAAVVTGAAQAAQISRTTLSAATSAGGSLGTPVTTAPAIPTAAPAVIQQVPVTRTLTGADVEDAINRRIDSLEVKLVWSDVERMEADRRVQIQGSHFRPAAAG